MRALRYDQQRIEEAMNRALQLLEPEGIFPKTNLMPLEAPEALAA